MFKKSIFSLCIALLIALSIGCSSVQTDNGADTGNSIKQDELQKEVVILDNEIIKATYLGVIDMPDIGYFYVNIKIDNKTDKEIWVTMESADVDGETVPMVVTGTYVHIRPGNSYAATFGFPMLKLSINSVKDAKEATFKLVVRDKENIMDTLFESDLITITLNQ